MTTAGMTSKDTTDIRTETKPNSDFETSDADSVIVLPINNDSKKLRQILSNETSMKILELLKEESLSASEVAEKLELPLTTVKYNIDQLVEYELAYVQRIKYSEKGRQVKIYEAQEKVIIFAPEKVNRVSLAAMLQKYAFAFMTAAFAGFGLNYIYQQYNSGLEQPALEPMTFSTGGEQDIGVDYVTTVSDIDIEEIIEAGGDPSFFHDIIISINDWFFDLLTHHSFWFIAGALFVCMVIWTIEYVSVKKEDKN
jgi:Predicted transcriptional regulator